MFSPMVHAELSPGLNDTPLVCDKGSKTSLMGEDGDAVWIADLWSSANPVRDKSCG